MRKTKTVKKSRAEQEKYYRKRSLEMTGKKTNFKKFIKEILKPLK